MKCPNEERSKKLGYSEQPKSKEPHKQKRRHHSIILLSEMATVPARLCYLSTNPTTRNLNFSVLKPNVLSLRSFSLPQKHYLRLRPCKCSSTAPVSTTTYEVTSIPSFSFFQHKQNQNI